MWEVSSRCSAAARACAECFVYIHRERFRRWRNSDDAAGKALGTLATYDIAGDCDIACTALVSWGTSLAVSGELHTFGCGSE